MRARDTYRSRWWTLAVLCLALSAVTIQDTVVNVALPTLARELSATAGQLQWIVESYVVTLGGLVLIAGALSDRYGRRLGLISGLVVFGGASAFAAFANSPEALIVARVLEGVGAAMIMPATLSVIRQVFPPDERKLAIGIWGGVTALSVVVGPVAGGWLLENYWWGAMFLINVPIAVVAAAGALRFVPEIRRPTSVPLDLPGMALAILGVGAFFFGVTEAPKVGLSDPAVLGPLVGGVVLLSAFLVRERRTRYPLLDLDLFRNRRFSAASLSAALAYSALFGVFFIVTQYMQYVLGYDPLQTGARLAPLVILVMVAGPLGGWLTGLLGARAVISGGLFLTAAGLAVFSTATPQSGYGLLVLSFALVGAGIGAASIAATDSVVGAAPEDKAGAAAAVDETAIQLGGALGIAVLGSILTSAYARSLETASGIEASVRQVAARSFEAASAEAFDLGGTAGEELLTLAREAFVGGAVDAALVGTGMTLIGAVIALAFLPSREAEQRADREMSRNTGVGSGGSAKTWTRGRGKGVLRKLLQRRERAEKGDIPRASVRWLLGFVILLLAGYLILAGILGLPVYQGSNG